MSIVKQIVDLSGGRIDIRSDLGKGTEISLSLPLENCQPDPEAMPGKSCSSLEEPVEAVRRRARGRTVTIRGFDDTSGNKSTLQLLALRALKASVEKYVTEWFGLKIVPAGDKPDIVISDESVFRHSTVAESSFRSLIILCSNGARRNISSGRLALGQTLEFASKPCGPHRLAKALLNCLDAENATRSRIPEERVSLHGPHDEVVSPNDAMVTAGTNSSSLRLIGDLQSSIGFSPTAINIIRLPASHTRRAVVSNSRRPSIGRRISSTVEEPDSSTSSSPETNTDETAATSCSVSSVSLVNSIERNGLNGRSAPNEVVTPVQKPKMLLVEVRCVNSIEYPMLTLLFQDNPVNMMLLATYMKKNKWEFEKASNGLLALQAFQRSPEGFDVIFMGPLPTPQRYSSFLCHAS
jgi:CheY-like chemotaxis protein